MIEIAKTCIVALMKARNFLICQCIEECVNWNKVEDGRNKGEEIFFKALANRFRLISKLIRRVKEQQSCLWPTFYQMRFMKR